MTKVRATTVQQPSNVRPKGDPDVSQIRRTGAGDCSASAVQLLPVDPPGRSNRKARGYADQIRSLHQHGYTFGAIRRALASIGIEVSIRTVQREAARSSGETAPLIVSSRLHAAPQGSPPAPEQHAMYAPPSRPVGTEPQLSSREIAEQYFEAHAFNPLIKQR